MNIDFKTRLFNVCVVLLTLFFIVPPAESSSTSSIHHRLTIKLEPVTRFATIVDTVQFKPFRKNCESFSFTLHAALKLSHHLLPAGWTMKTSVYNNIEGRLLKIDILKNDSTPCPETFSMELGYSGVLLELSPDETVGSGRFFIAGDSYFYPQFSEPSSLLRFEMQVSLPQPWHSMSQGQRFEGAVSQARNTVTWKSSKPSEEIYLIGDRYHIYEDEHNGLSLYAFLLDAEEKLAEKYLVTAKAYIDFYSKLIGPYPYEKFALVENSQQTGYGMPSFTLMGSRIIRFPFILNSSYPHEILHNWWGNGVFPDLKQGNWSEGLTAYLADHLLLELKGKGASYRFQEMMKFSNYVNEANDFPLSAFAYRDSMSSQAIGYAKLLMVFHMLRTQLGDANFIEGLQKFYTTFKYRYAGYADMEKVFEAVSGQNLSEFFEQWIHRKGAPEISLKESSYVAREGRYDLSVRVEQVSPRFKLRLPIAIWTLGSPVAEIYYVNLGRDRQTFNFNLTGEPLAVRLDPYNDVLRRLGAEESPASLSQTYGAQRVMATVSENEQSAYQPFAQAVAEPKNILPAKTEYPDGGLWVFGHNHPLKKMLTAQLKQSGIEVEEGGIRIQGQTYPWENHSFVFTLNRIEPKQGTLTWVIADKEASIPGLIRKLPHYGKYGYLVFGGTAPDNRNKGIWPSNPIGLQKVFRKGHSLSLPEQKPLANFNPFN